MPYLSNETLHPTSQSLATRDASVEPGLQRRSAGRFRETQRIRVLRGAFGKLSAVAPGLTAHLAYGLLARPPRSAEKPWQSELRFKARASRLDFGAGDLAVYEWGDGPTVLMVHGWGARATHMGKMIDPLVTAGFRVIAFDAPAHGESHGKSTDLVQFSAAIAAVARHVGPIHTILAHSFGVAMALYAQRDWGVESKAQILISSFDHCKWFTDAFSAYLGLRPGVMEQARQKMVDRYSGRFNWDQMSVVEMLRRTRQETFLIHDLEDPEIPFKHSIALWVQGAPSARFLATSGLGHHRLLGNPEVIGRVVDFVSRVGVTGCRNSVPRSAVAPSETSNREPSQSCSPTMRGADTFNLHWPHECVVPNRERVVAERDLHMDCGVSTDEREGQACQTH